MCNEKNGRRENRTEDWHTLELETSEQRECVIRSTRCKEPFKRATTVLESDCSVGRGKGPYCAWWLQTFYVHLTNCFLFPFLVQHCFLPCALYRCHSFSIHCRSIFIQYIHQVCQNKLPTFATFCKRLVAPMPSW